MFNPQPREYCAVDAGSPPLLTVVVDTEEEFDWSTEVSRGNTAVRCIKYLRRVQDIFDEFRIVPLYAVDYPVVSQDDGCRVLQEIYADGRCAIGAHLDG